MSDRESTWTIWSLALAIAVLSVLGASRDLISMVGFVTVALLAGVLVFYLWRRDVLSIKQLLFWAVIFRLLVVWLPPSLSDDAYRYVWDGWVQTQGINPYHYAPEDPALSPLQQDELFDNLNSQSFYSVYPPVSQFLFAFSGLFYPLGWTVSYYVIKCLLALFEVGALFLLARMVAPRLLVLYALNPLVIIEAAGQAHTESVMVFFLVLTVYLARENRGGWASVALACAGWVKLYPFVFFPLLWRRFGWRAVWPGAIIGIMIAIPYAASFTFSNVSASLDLYTRYFEFNAGYYFTLKQVFLWYTGEDWSKLLGPALRLIFLVSLPVIYLLDWQYKWELPRSMLVITGLFLLLATTVHPWYLVGVLALMVMNGHPSWHWLWLGIMSLGTYLLYVNGWYWLFVIAGWWGWLVLAVYRHHKPLLQQIQIIRSRRKAVYVKPFLPATESIKILDLGAGEGYVGKALQEQLGASVILADVVPMNRTNLPFVQYDGKHLPFEDNQFDVTLLYFVLHHCEDQQAVVQEAMRVSRKLVLIAESVYDFSWDLSLLKALDTLANRVRSGGMMNAQEEHLQFRTMPEWKHLFETLGAEVIGAWQKGKLIHKQGFFLLKPPS